MTNQSHEMTIQKDIHQVDANEIIAVVNTPGEQEDDNEHTEKQRIARVFNRERVNLEPHQLVCCDASVNIMANAESAVTLVALRKIVDYTKLFDNVEECQQYLTQTIDSVTFLVCSVELGKKMIPEIHQLGNVRSIYIYCRDLDYHKKWPSNFTKVKDVYINLDELLKDLNENVEAYLKTEKSGIFTELDKKDSTTDNWLTWWSSVIDVITQLPYPDISRQKLVFVLKDYYQGKSVELRILEEFERDYTSSNSIHWYTRDTFLYRLVNKALRQENVESLFLFGFFVRDLYFQLKQEHAQFKLRHQDQPVISVYRGQIMSLNEIKKLESSLERQAAAVSIKSFFSTSANRALPLLLQQPSVHSSDEFHTVLLEIGIDMQMDSRPFGYVSHLSQFPDENEILFMTGMQFEVIKISYDEGFYTIKLKLIDDYLYDESNFHNLSTSELLKVCTDLLVNSLPTASAEQIVACFSELSCLFPSEKGWLEASKYQSLALCYQLDPKDYMRVISMYEKAIETWEKCIYDGELNCDAKIGEIHRDISDIYRSKIKDNSLADKHYNLGIHCCKNALEKTDNEEKTAQLYKLLNSLYTNKVNFSPDEAERKQCGSDAIRYLELYLQWFKKQPPYPNPEVLFYLIEIADTQKSICLFEEALINYNQFLAICKQQYDTLYHLFRIEVSKQIVEIYMEYKEDFVLALKYQLIAHELTLKDNIIEPDDDIWEIGSKNGKIAHSHQKLADIYIKLGQHNLAHENLSKARMIYESTDIQKKEDQITAIDEKVESIRSFLSKESVEGIE